MKIWKVFVGIGVVLCAVLIMLNAFGVLNPLVSSIGEISVLSVILGLLLLAFTIVRLTRGKIQDIFVPLALIFMLFEKNIAILCGFEADHNLINNWLLLLCAVMLWIGSSILASSFRKNKKKKDHGFRMFVKGDDEDGDNDGKRGFVYENNMQATVRYIDCTDFEYKNIENNFGFVQIFFENVDKYKGDGVIYMESNFGKVEINVPSSWRCTQDVEVNFGSISEQNGGGDENGQRIFIRGENNFGHVSIKYV